MERRSIDQEFTNELLEFLYRAQLNGYGSDKEPSISKDGTHMLSYAEEGRELEYADIWYGGEPFRGMTVIRRRGIVCWVMTYGGEVFAGIDKEPIYTCLRAALTSLDHDAPWRGPAVLTHENGMRYVNRWTGDITKFKGKEYIYQSGASRLYEATYEGGFVDLD